MRTVRATHLMSSDAGFTAQTGNVVFVQRGTHAKRQLPEKMMAVFTKEKMVITIQPLWELRQLQRYVQK